jgi:hypothetical protein
MSRVGDEPVPGHPALTDEGPIRHMWERFADLGDYEQSVIDTSEMDPAQTADLVHSPWLAGADRMSGSSP